MVYCHTSILSYQYMYCHNGTPSYRYTVIPVYTVITVYRYDGIPVWKYSGRLYTVMKVFRSTVYRYESNPVDCIPVWRHSGMTVYQCDGIPDWPYTGIRYFGGNPTDNICPGQYDSITSNQTTKEYKLFEGRTFVYGAWRNHSSFSNSCGVKKVACLIIVCACMNINLPWSGSRARI